ncbi:hypothetical protein ACOSZF_18545 [Cytobacillus firmus]|uniref:hypothetical protein n=1 Tax=Cytobacillus firmus TaxID=1399 RepID=UPI0015804C64|nr:hypothetical protein [Cytobacillus firmus]MBG9549026.1 hypothetical protein [Cytobacillus firmus]MBG9602179.1 hypothetical protein [Cytobacillus firmus]MED1941463.1 hypothetical protein [Cytobacillus firmus]NUH85338.1 hypothetical protein [Cytobacillus firmus]
MQSKQIRLRRIQSLAHDIMVEMNTKEDHKKNESYRTVIDDLSRAIGELSDPSGDYSFDYVEEKVATAHYKILKNMKKLTPLRKTKESAW